MMDFFTIKGEPLSVKAPILGYIGDMPVTNTMVMGILGLLFFIGLCVYAQTFRVKNPSRGQIVVETIATGIVSFLSQIIGDVKVAARVMPIVSTLVLFILVSNLIGLFLPFLSGFTYNGITLFRSQTNDFNTTFALALGMIILTQIYSIGKFNIINHVFRYIQIKQVVIGFSKGVGSGFLSLVNFFVGLLDLVSEFARIISLSLRLFGNIFAGELLVGVLMTMFALALPLPILMLSLLSGTIQAIVFGSLVASYFAGVLKDEN